VSAPPSAAEIIRKLALKPHPEGGHYRETFRDAPANGARGAMTAIYYLLAAGEESAWHKVDATEIWHYYAGARLSLSISDNGRDARVVVAELVPDLLWSNDPEGYTTWYSRRWLEYTGLTIEQTRGFGWLDVLHPEDREGSLVRFLKALEAGEPLRYEQRIRGADGHYRWFLIQSRPVHDEAGRILQWFGAATDIQDLRIAMEATRASLAEKEALLKEVHHRVKNNLQVISSLLDLQSMSIKDKQAAGAVKEGKMRVQSMALIHQNLYSEGNIKGIVMEDYIKKLAENLFHSYNIRKDKIQLIMDVDDLNLDVDTVIPLGLIMNELITNSLKYAFKEQDHGEICVSLRENNKRLELLVRDNGCGFPPHLNQIKNNSFGFSLVNAFAQKLKAKLDIYNNGGACVAMNILRYKRA